MTNFQPGDLVLFTRGATDQVATVREAVHPFDDEHGWIVDTLGGSPWFATPDQLTQIPGNPPVFRLGDPVRVDPAAPCYAGRTGTVAAPEFLDGELGYHLNLPGTDGLVWVPAVALTADGSVPR